MIDELGPTSPGRSLGAKIIRGGVIVGVVGVLPLLLCILLGNANPIGLGLLAALAVPISATAILVGVITILAEPRRL